jgi:hypothetical protein
MLAVVSLTLSVGSYTAADWKPAAAPLMTPWGRQVTADPIPWPEYPRPQMARTDWQNLNGLWDYAITAKDAPPPQTWDGKILVPFCVESALSGVGRRVSKDQHLWYRRTVEVPAAWNGQRVLLHFQAVDWEATVWVNGRELGTHRGMSDPFTFDITDALTNGTGELLLRVWDPTDEGSQPRGKQVRNPHGIWYTPVTGIWQTVWLEPVPPTHITRLRFTPDIDTGEVEVVADVAGRFGDDATILVRTRENVGHKILGRGKPGRPFRIKVENPKLWSPDSPHLYEVDVGLLTRQADSDWADTVASYFALRKISAAKDDRGIMRMMLNNKPLFQIGPLDQGWWPDGLLTPPSDEAMRFDLEVIKTVGYNMLRKHIKVEPARLYYHCDRIGLLVWQDMPSGFLDPQQFVQPDWQHDAEFSPEEKQQFRTELKAMIDHLGFFPCIVVWVPFNEGWGQHDTNAILKWVKAYDPTRLVGGPSGWTDRGTGDLKDMHRYPGPGMFPPMPDRVSVLGEFGGLGLPIQGHLWKKQDNWGYRTYQTKEDLRTAYRQLMLKLHPLIEQGLAAAVYTQTTDVEVEVNGLLTYDRAVLKFDPAEMRQWHEQLFGPPPQFRVVVPTSEKEPQTWRYTTTKPADGWQQPGFDDSAWKAGQGGFGSKGTPGAVIGTEWTQRGGIWLRRTFELDQLPQGEVMLRLHQDDEAEVYINGVLAAKPPGYTVEYGPVVMTPASRRALKRGTNVIAVYCTQDHGGQFIDVGLVELK